VERLREWHEWYDFARETLEYEHDEAASYADARYLEETNRDRLAELAAPAYHEGN
jgi:hypothetical protein